MAETELPPKRGTRDLVVSSQAASRLAAARAWLAALPRAAEVLILAPHGHAADALLQAEVADSGSRFGPFRLTIDRLAARLAAPAMVGSGTVAVTSLSLTAVAARALHSLIERGAAGRFAEIGNRPGLPHAIVRTLEDLRGAGIEAGALRRAAPWGTDLAAILERVEAELNELHLADRLQLFTLARAAIEHDGAPPAGLPILMLDLAVEDAFEDDLLRALLDRAPSALATALEGDPVVERLESVLGVEAKRPAPPRSLRDAALKSFRDDSSSLERLQQHLFASTAPEPRALDGSVSLTSWPGEARECVEIARRIQEEAAGGTSFDRIAVLLRAPLAYRAHLEEALRRASIPAYFARGTTRPEPAGRAFLALLACAAERLSARRFAEYLSLAQVPDPDGPSAETWAPPAHELMPWLLPGDGGPLDASEAAGDVDPEHRATGTDAGVVEGTLRAPWRWERLLVDAAVIGSHERWRRRLDGLAEEICVRRREVVEEDARAATLARIAADLDQLRTFALPVVARLADFPAQATWAEWLKHLRALAGAAIRHPDGVLRILTELEPLGPVGPVDLEMVHHVLAPRLRDLTFVPERRYGGAVFVAPIEMARGLEFDVVFVPGLAEKLFPPRIIEDPMLPDEARRALGGRGLATLDTRATSERLALRLAVGAAGKHVALSWPKIDLENARARVPSFYGLEAMLAAEGRLPGFDELQSRAEAASRSRLGWPAPERPEQAIDDTEYDLAVLARLKDADPATSAGAANYLMAANPHLARALRARGRRWLRRWTPADGLVDPDQDSRAAIARHRMGARSFSPTALENFSACPYRFLLQAVHRLQPREEAEPLETIDPLTRGALFHEVQFMLLTALRERGHLPLAPGGLETAFGLLDEVMAPVAAGYEERLAPAITRVWIDGVNAIKADLREWLRRAAEEAQPWVPYRFELSFGLAEGARATADAASAPEPVRVLDGVLLRGSIDLVERRADGGLRVTDHKTGKARVPDGAIVWGGQALQPVLYALAAEALLRAPVESGRLYYCTADGDFTERMIPLDDVSRGHATTAVGVVARALEQGFLPAAPAPDACRWCDYRQVCGPYEESRTARKPPERLADLANLRRLP